MGQDHAIKDGKTGPSLKLLYCVIWMTGERRWPAVGGEHSGQAGRSECRGWVRIHRQPASSRRSGVRCKADEIGREVRILGYPPTLSLEAVPVEMFWVV